MYNYSKFLGRSQSKKQKISPNFFNGNDFSSKSTFFFHYDFEDWKIHFLNKEIEPKFKIGNVKICSVHYAQQWG